MANGNGKTATDAPRKDTGRDWSQIKTTTWWVKYVGAITAAFVLGGYLGKALGFKSAEEAKFEHAAIEQKIEETKKEAKQDLKDALGEVKTALTNLSIRIDNAVQRKRR